MNSTRTLVMLAAGAVCTGSVGTWAQTPAPNGESLFQARCATCHNGQTDSRAPAPEALKQRSAASILDALSNGAMRVQGASLSGPERHAIAEFLGGAIAGDATGAGTGLCANTPTFHYSDRGGWNGWGVSTANTREQSKVDAGLTAEQLPKLELKWAFGFPDATSSWAQPAVVAGWVFVGSQNGTVYGLDAKTGCIHWYFSADGGVRTAVSVGARFNGGTVYFGDTSGSAYALDAATGQLLWKTKVEEHPLARITGAPTLYKDRLYVPMSSYEETQGARPEYGCCTFRGSVSALDAKSGKILWRTYMIPDTPLPRGQSANGVTLFGPAGAAIWSSPTVDVKRKRLYVGTGNSYAGSVAAASDSVVALELSSGKLEWSKQLFGNDVFVSGCRPGSTNPNCADQKGPDYDFGNSPIVAEVHGGKSIIVIGQKSGNGWGLDPDNQGAVLWQYHAGAGGALGGIEWGSAVDAEHAYFAVSDIFSPAPGGLHAVNLKDGSKAWYAAPATPTCAKGGRCSAAQAAAISVIPGVVFSGSNDGTLRAYSTADGNVIWSVDTEKEFTTVNGVPGRGASMLGPGPVIAGSMLYVPSGYGAFGGRPGNVLLAYGLAEDHGK
jgi:polyvinyl alcohol dehydrogenase (cytochrome)